MGKACQNCLRTVVGLFNFIFVIIGLAILALALYIFLAPVAQDLTMATGHFQNIKYTLFALMGLGGFTVVVGGLGCCGAFFESPCALGTYFTLVFFIFAGEVVVGVLGYFYKDQLKKGVGDVMQAGVNNLKKNDTNSKKTFYMDTVQSYFNCCGQASPGDYCTNGLQCKLPESCCVNKKDCGTPRQLLKVFKTGCQKELKDYIKKHYETVFIVVLSIAGLELFGLIFSLVLCCIVRKENTGYMDVDHNGD